MRILAKIQISGVPLSGGTRMIGLEQGRTHEFLTSAPEDSEGGSEAPATVWKISGSSKLEH